MIALTTIGLILIIVGGIACIWIGAKFKPGLQKLPFVGRFF